jgi:alcohol dehydrogenase (cytochrome c)
VPRSFTRSLRCAFAAAALLMLPAGALADPPAAVGAAQIEGADQDANSWLVYGRTLSAQRHSPLTQIDASNVKRLVAAWTKTLGPASSMEGTPIVSNGVMYLTTGKSTVYAVDAVTGKTIWKYVYPLPATAAPKACCNVNNRGVTLTGDVVVTGTLDAHLVALDAKTGKVRWNTTVADVANAYTITSPPLPVKDMLIQGVGGGEYPTHGFIAAYGASTGKLRWKTSTIPGKGEPGSETWGVRGTAERGGAPTWLPGAYDPQLNLLYWGTGNPNPDFDTNATKGNLLYTSSMLALNPDTGKITWYYQFTPHNIWDYDAVNQPVLVDVPMNGSTVAAVAHADRNGYLYLLDRATGKLIYAVPFIDKITWGTVDRTTGKIGLNAAIQAAAKAAKPYAVWPSVIGGANWEPPAYDPQHHLFFIPAIESSLTIVPEKKPNPNPKPGVYNFGGTFTAPASFPGSVSAWDLATGKMLWKRHFRSPSFGGALSTAGGLVFVGQMDGELDALDAQSGKTLWSAKTASGINAPPMTFSQNGIQYVSVEAGIGGVFPIYFMPFTPWLKNVKPGSLVYTYKLPAAAAAK